MLTITLYKMSAEDNRVDKSSALSEDLTLPITLKFPTDITNPSIDVRLDTIDEKYDITTYNYAYLPEFKRFYFITGARTITNGVWNLSLHVDVLMSFKDQFLPLKAMIARNEFTGITYLRDKLMPFTEEIFYKRIVGPSIKEMHEWSEKSALIVLTANPSLCRFTGGAKLDSNHGDNLIIDMGGINNPSSKSYAIYMFYGEGAIYEFLQSIASQERYRSYIIQMYLLPNCPLMVESMVQYETGFTECEYEVGDDKKKIYRVELFESGYKNSISTKVILPTTDKEGNTLNGSVYIANGNPRISFQRTLSLGTTRSYLPYQDFRGLSPHSEYRLFVPYYGWYELDATLFSQKMNITNETSNILATYYLDVSDGSCIIELKLVRPFEILNQDGYYTHGDIPIDILNTQIGLPIPITGDDADAIQRNKTAYQLKATGGYITGSLQLVGGMASFGTGLAMMSNPATSKLGTGLALGGTRDITGGVSTLVSTATTQEANNVTNVTHGTSSTFYSYYLQGQTAQQLILEITYHRSLVGDQLDEYGRLNGFPTFRVQTLNETHGFTTIDDIHLEITCYKAEKSELYQLMQNGIILP